jgi:hypothetical protein
LVAGDEAIVAEGDDGAEDLLVGRNHRAKLPGGPAGYGRGRAWRS